MSRTAPNITHAAGDDAGWALIAFLVSADLLAEACAPLPINVSSLSALAVACIALTGAACFYRYVRPQPNFSAMCLVLMQALLFSVAGAILSYLLARTSTPLWDHRLAAWDQSLGLNWLSYVRLVDAHGWAALALHLAYGSLIPQVIAVILALGFSNRIRELRIFLFAAILCGTVTILASHFFPAADYYVSLNISPHQFRHVHPWAGYTHMHDLIALRERSMTILNLRTMQGIITFPSYHAGLAISTLWGFWAARRAWIRWPGISVGLLTIAATPVDGGHYFVDVIAGLGVAVCSLAIARRAIFWRLRPVLLKASPFRRSRAAFAP